MVEGENVLHHIKKEGGIAGEGKMSGGMSGGICPGESMKLWFCGYVGMSVTQSGPLY